MAGPFIGEHATDFGLLSSAGLMNAEMRGKFKQMINRCQQLMENGKPKTSEEVQQLQQVGGDAGLGGGARDEMSDEYL